MLLDLESHGILESESMVAIEAFLFRSTRHWPRNRLQQGVHMDQDTLVVDININGCLSPGKELLGNLRRSLKMDVQMDVPSDGGEWLVEFRHYCHRLASAAAACRSRRTAGRTW